MEGYAEHQIDRKVFQRFFGNQPGTMLEIGAARPDWLSIGALYRAKGWDVLSVEPNPVFAAAHRALGHDVAEVALCEDDNDMATFTVADSHGAEYREGQVTFESFSSLGIRGDFAELGGKHGHQTIQVRTCRADTLLAETRPNWEGIDLVAVDIEGWELDALRGLNFERFRPKVIIVENLFVSASYRRFMRARGYFLWRRLSPNEIFVRRDMEPRGGQIIAEMRAVLPTIAGRIRCTGGRLYRAIKRLHNVVGINRRSL